MPAYNSKAAKQAMYNNESVINCQYSVINMPIELAPTATVGDVEIICCESPTVLCGESQTGEGCQLIVEQRVCLRIPITYNIAATSGNGTISCGPVTGTGCGCD